MLNIIKRYFILIIMFAKNSLAAQLEYRINFILGMAVEAGFLVVKLTYVILIYKTGVNINGMSPDYMLVFIGTYTIMTGIYMSFYTNFWNLTNYIREGTLDLYLTKPVSGMFLVTFRYIDFATPIPAVTAGFIMLGIGWNRCGFDFNILNIGIFIGCLAIGTVLTYSIFLMPRLLGFWTMSTGGIAQISDSVWDFNNMPMKIYNKIIQDIGCYIFPVFLITNVPGLIVGGHISKILIIWYFMAPVIMFNLCVIMWKMGIRRYSSASS